MQTVMFGGRSVGPDHAPYVIAEIGSNHNGDMRLCRTIIDAARAAGADAVKFQSWSSTSLICQAEFERNTSYVDKKRHFGSLRDMVERYAFTPDQHREIARYCNEVEIDFMSSSFARDEVDLVVGLGTPALKVASMDVNYFSLLEYMGGAGKPVILSTGMASLGEIEAGLAALRRGGAREIVLLHCVSVYPTPARLLHLRNLQTLAHAFGVPVGFSDHSQGTTAAVTAVSLGACLIEKHFTVNREMDGWDHHMSADPDELGALVAAVKYSHEALGSRERTVGDEELAKRAKFRRSMVARRPLSAGSVLRAEDVDFKRPGDGIGPNATEFALGRRLRRNVAWDEEISWSDLGELGQE